MLIRGEWERESERKIKRGKKGSEGGGREGKGGKGEGIGRLEEKDGRRIEGETERGRKGKRQKR